MEKKYLYNGMFTIGDEVLKEKELQFKNNSTAQDHHNNSEDDETGIKKPQIFIDELFKMKEHFTIDQMKDELNNFILAVSKITLIE